MGVEWYLADSANRRIFVLGKSRYDVGEWIVTRARLLAPKYPSAREVFSMFVNDAREREQRVQREQREGIDVAYLAECAAHLWAFCATAAWKLAVRDDCSDHDDEWSDGGEGELAAVRWPEVGGFYRTSYRSPERHKHYDPDPLAKAYDEKLVEAWADLRVSQGHEPPDEIAMVMSQVLSGPPIDTRCVVSRTVSAGDIVEALGDYATDMEANDNPNAKAVRGAYDWLYGMLRMWEDRLR